ncbi:MAG: tripartite tricarboxylate transporter TctB family protein [Burkholderiales bacterium]
MADDHGSARVGARTVVFDLVVAVVVFTLGAIVGYDSYRLGASWGSDGPQAGYFPFYIGLLICICSAVVFVQSFVRLGTDRKVFVTAGQFRQVLVILLPSAAYVFGVWLIGIYVSSLLFITLFMRIAGRYSWLRSTVVGLAVSVSAFVLFEIWFKIPLPKGPVERLLGF